MLPAAFRRLSAAPAARTLPAGSCAPRPGPWFFRRLPLGEVATAEGRCPRSRRGGLDGEARRGPHAASHITGLRGQPGPRPLGEERRAGAGTEEQGRRGDSGPGCGEPGGEEGSKWPSARRENIRAQGTGQSWPGDECPQPLALPRLPGLWWAHLPPAVSCFAGARGVQRTQGAAPAPRWSLARESPWLNPPGQRAVLPCPVFRRSLRNSMWHTAIALSLCGLGPFVTQQQVTETPGWRGCWPTKGGQHADGGGVSWPQSGSPHPRGPAREEGTRPPLLPTMGSGGSAWRLRKPFVHARNSPPAKWPIELFMAF